MFESSPIVIGTTTGIKQDQDKAPWDLLPFDALGPVVAVLRFGASKYAPENWRKVEQPQRRYFAAALRHLVAWKLGQRLDPETSLPHLAHAAACVLFMVALDEPKADS
jgi:hypothetical protein